MVEQIVSGTLVIQKYAINNRIQNVLNSLNSKAISGKNIMNYNHYFLPEGVRGWKQNPISFFTYLLIQSEKTNHQNQK